MSNYIISLNKRHYAFNDRINDKTVLLFLAKKEPWSMIAMDAFLHYGLDHPQHKWLAELDGQGRIEGIVYIHENHVHFAYGQAPRATSPIYNYMYQEAPSFITHGNEEIIRPIISHLSGYVYKNIDHSHFVKQTGSTTKIINHTKIILPHIKVRPASPSDFSHLKNLYRHSEVESQIDMSLVQELIRRRSIIVAEKSGYIIGTAMILMEGLKYALLGGLYVTPRERKQHVASLLGQQLVQMAWMKNKRICFYYNDLNLTPFYQKIAFEKIGKWVSYALHKKK